MRTDDTYSLVIALGYKHFFNTLEIWLEARVQGKNNLQFINVNSIYSELGETLCKALPAYHALTGCNYTASFFKKSKVRLLKLLQKDTDAQIVLSELSTLEEIDENTISTIEGYVCKVYASKNICKVNDIQTQIFLNKYTKIKPEDHLNCVKKFDSSLIPPCKGVLLPKIKRVHLIVRRWASAIVVHPPDDKPEKCGLTFSNDGKYIIKWFEGPAAPRVLDVTISKDTKPSTENDTKGSYKAITIQVRFCGKLKVLIKLSLYKFVFAVN